MSSLISCASLTHKKDKPNQDYCETFNNPSLNFKGVIVADGLGSHFKSELSSKFCVKRLKENLENIDHLVINYSELFLKIKKDLEIYAENNLTPEEKASTFLGTTLICALEFEDEYQIAYIGNGSIWQISGNFNHFSASRSLPWNSINLLNPHNIEEEGESKMFKYISTADVSSIPSVIKLSKNEDAYGDIIVIATDGIYSNDEAKIGKDNKGVIWEMGEETMIELYKSLNELFVKSPIEIKEDDLKFELEKYLNLIKEQDIMDDDTTLGLIISEKVIQYQHKCWEKRDKLNINSKNYSALTNTNNINSNSCDLTDETNSDK
jgi:serine/threonine protein phosphatase PrpC